MSNQSEKYTNTIQIWFNFRRFRKDLPIQEYVHSKRKEKNIFLTLMSETENAGKADFLNNFLLHQYGSEKIKLISRIRKKTRMIRHIIGQASGIICGLNYGLHESPRISQHYGIDGLRVAINWGPIMPRDACLSDN